MAWILLIGVVLALVAIFLPKYSAKKDKPEKKKP
jgi:hypothetical protein